MHLAEVIVFFFPCVLSYLPSSHCSRYSVMNLENRTEKYIKILSIELAVSEVLGGSPMNQVYSLSGNTLNKAYIISSRQK